MKAYSTIRNDTCSQGTQRARGEGAFPALQRIYAAARMRADEITVQAEKAAELTHAEGFREGICHGEEAVRSCLEDLVAWKENVEEVFRERVLRLGVQIAEEIVGDALKFQPESLRERLLKALGRIDPTEVVTLRLNRDDSLRIAIDGRVIRVVEDLTLPVGAFKLEVGGCAIECNPWRKLDELRSRCVTK